MSLRYTAVPHHQQDQTDYCGPAIAQMLLGSLGVPIATMHNGKPTGNLVQTRLWGNIQACGTEAGWTATSPDALVCVLNAQRPSSIRRNFVVSADSEPARACARIAATITQTGIAVPAVVFDAGHWLVVNGVEYDAPPAGEQATIRGFYFNNPLPFTPATTGGSNPPGSLYPLPHCDGDSCGTGDAFGTSPEYATIYGWLRDYWYTPCSIYQSYVSVSNVPLAAGAIDRFSGNRLESRAPSPITTPGQAMTAAVPALTSDVVARDGPLARLLNGLQPLSAVPLAMSGMPNVVDYWVVRLQCDNNVFAQASLDANTGELRGLQVPAGSSLPDNYSADVAYTALQAQWWQFRTDFDDHVVAPNDVVVSSVLLSHPSRLSGSPFRPFAAVGIRGKRHYLGPDRKLRRSLDEH